MAHGHSAIDSLIALTALRKYQEGGEVTPPTMGQRFVQRFPSQHEERASEQERGLANLIDLVMPQSVTEAGLMLAAGPLVGKAGKAYGSTRSALDKLLSKYGKKAHSQIRALIDENRAIALDLPERAIPMERAIDRMIRIIEPDAKKRKMIHNAWSAEEWEEFTGVLQKKVLGALNK